MEKKVKIDDTLEERIFDVFYEIKEHFINWLEDNQDCTDFEEYYQECGCDNVFECSDSSTPIYTTEIDDLWYLYSSEFLEALDFAGFDTNSENLCQTAIYCYISQKGFEFMNDLQYLFQNYLSENEKINLAKIKREIEDMYKDYTI
jgi:hypothetical protein